jgi:hypothetical protein
MIWLKINDSFGFVAISQGETMSDIDNHLSGDEIDSLLGVGVFEKISSLNNTNYLTEETIKYMESLGWFENDDFWKSNGDVHAHCFEKKI